MAGSVNVRLVGLNVEGYADFAKALHESSPLIEKNLRRALRKVGYEAKDVMEAKSKRHSNSIPETLKVSLNRNGVSITAGGKDQPLARLYEIGNVTAKQAHGIIHNYSTFRSVNAKRRVSKGRGKLAAGTLVFRHPVYDKGGWTEQQRYPFMAETIEEMRPQIEHEAKAAIDLACSRLRRDFTGRRFGK